METPKDSTPETSNVVDIVPEINRRNKKLFSNHSTTWSKGKPVFTGFDALEIHAHLKELIGEWPRRVESRLFIINKGKIRWFFSSSDFFGWLSSEGVDISWKEKAINGITKQEFFKALQGLATDHVGISILPHFPPRPGYYYVPMELPESSEAAFEQLLSLFNPATNGDAEILKSAFLSLFWGGPPGHKPAFVFMGMDDDDGGGRGVGKTTLTDIMADLCGGAIEFSAKTEDIDAMKKRILTSGGERVIRFDNVKTSRLSSGDIESLITSAYISGHRLFLGNAKIPNDFTYLFTFNDASFSKDMAQRAIPIKLKRPIYAGNWVEDMASFIDARRLHIIAGIRDCYAEAPNSNGGVYLRFGQWTRDVLFRSSSDPEIVRSIKDFQKEVDDDDGVSEEIASIIRYQIGKFSLESHGMSSNVPVLSTDAPLLIRNGLINQWVAMGLNMKASNRSISKMVARAKIPEFIDEKTHDGYPCHIWCPGKTSDGIQGAWLIFEDSKINRVVSKFVAFKMSVTQVINQEGLEPSSLTPTNQSEDIPWPDSPQ